VAVGPVWTEEWPPLVLEREQPELLMAQGQKPAVAAGWQ
jgi:hypothetical protein